MPTRPPTPFGPGCSSLLSLALLTAAARWAAPEARAQNATWISSSDTDFNNAANWSGTLASEGNVTFDGTGTANPTLTSGFTVKTVSFTGGAYTLSGSTSLVFSSPNGLGLGISVSGSSGTQTISVPLTLTGANTWSAASGNALLVSGGVDLGASSSMAFTGAGNVTVSGGISGFGSLLQDGSGKTTLSSANTYTGTTQVNSGTLQLTGGNNLLSSASNLTVSGGVLDLGGTTQTLANVVTVTGGTIQNGTLQANAGLGLTNGNISAQIKGTTVTMLVAGSATLSNDSNAFTGPLSVTGGTVTITSIANQGVSSAAGAGNSITLGANGTLSYAGPTASTNRSLTLMAGTFTIDGSGSGPVTFAGGIAGSKKGTRTLTLAGTTQYNTISGVIGENGTTSLVKAGSGSWILSGTNSFDGNAAVNAGTLYINGSINSSGTMIVNSGGTLGGTGSINRPTTINSGGTLAPGASPGVLTFAGALTLNAGSTTLLEINGTTRGTGYDGINVGGLLTPGGTLQLSFGSTFSSGSFDLFQITGSLAPDTFFGTVTASGSYDGTFANAGGTWTLTSHGQLLTFDQSTGDLTIAGNAVPEPSTWSVFAGVAALGAVMWRRGSTRRRNESDHGPV